MIADELRATFARHENLTPAEGPLRLAIARTATRRRRRRLVVRSAGTVLAVLAAVGVPALGRTLTANPARVAPTVVGAPSASLPEAPLNLLALGVDTSLAHARSDAVLLVHIPRDRSRVYLIALPRDLVVPIPGHGSDKLSASFDYGSRRAGAAPDLAAGARFTAAVVSDLTGTPVTGSVAVTYAGLRSVTDAVGGVQLCLPRAVTSVHTGRVFPANCQRLDGAAAVDLLRQRLNLPGGAFDRDRNAERFAGALLDKVASGDTITDPARMNALVKAAGKGVVLDGLRLADLLRLLPQLNHAQVTGIGWAPPAGPAIRLDPTLAGSLFDALRRDTVGEWAAAHPGNVTERN